eukprot:gene11191-4011_t
MNKQRNNKLLRIKIPNNHFNELEAMVTHSPLKDLPSPLLEKQEKNKFSQKSLKDTEVKMIAPHKKDGRSWIISKMKDNIHEANWKIELKTRSEEFKETIEEKLFSSLKYEIKIQIDDRFLSKYPLLVCRIHLEDEKQIVKEIIAGNLEFTCSKTQTKTSTTKNDTCCSYIGFCKFQFTDVSLHHRQSGNFNFVVQLFNPEEMNESLIEIKSSGFKITARREPLKKRKKGLENFETKLNELEKLYQKLSSTEKKRGLEVLSEKLHSPKKMKFDNDFGSVNHSLIFPSPVFDFFNFNEEFAENVN